MARNNRGGRRADYSWSSIAGSISALDLAIGSDGRGDEGGVIARAGTIVRIRGLVTAELDAGAATAENALITVGIIMASENAFGAGAASLPNPEDDPGEDWIWQGHLYVTTGSTFAGAEEGVNEVDKVVCDSKAMRKVKPSEVIAVMASVVESDDQTGTVDLKYTFRILAAE